MNTRITIIGAGIIGASIARILTKYDLEVNLIERAVDVGWGTSKANTGILHGGYDDDPEKYPMRARMCAEGNRIWHQWVEELEIPHAWNGALVVAQSEEDHVELEKLYCFGRKNAVPNMGIVDKDEILKLEPNISPLSISGLWVPTVGQIGPVQAVISLVENSVSNSARLHLDTEVTGIEIRNGKVEGVNTSGGFIGSDIIINAAGLYADRISRMAGLDYYNILPRKGEYCIFDDDAFPKPERVIFPTPTKAGKGVLVTTEVFNHLMIGPNSQELPQDRKEDSSTTEEGMEQVWRDASKIFPKLPPRKKVIRTFAGLRPEASGGDFIIKKAGELYGFIDVAGIRSPGLTSAPAIAYYVKEMLEAELGITLKEKKVWRAKRRDISHFYNVPWNKMDGFIKMNPSNGKIVCRCSKVSEADVIEAIERMRSIGVKACSLDSVKYRTKAMTGTCQGSFCRIRISQLLSEKCGIPLWKVTQRGAGSEIGVGDVKCLLADDL